MGFNIGDKVYVIKKVSKKVSNNLKRREGKMVLVLKQVERNREYDLIVNTDKIDTLIEYQCRIVINGQYHRITKESYEKVREVMLGKEGTGPKFNIK